MHIIFNGVDYTEQSAITIVDIDETADIIEEHFHNNDICFGNGATEDSLTPYTIISGNGAFGSEVLILDTANTPFRTGKTKFDFHKIIPLSVSSATVYIIRIIWGTGTVAAAETALQYSSIAIISTGTGNNVKGNSTEILMPRLDIGTKIWCKIKNATNLATITALFKLHEYDE